MVLASSTRMTSLRSDAGDRLITLWKVRSRDDQCSSRNGMTTDTVGRSEEYVLEEHLRKKSKASTCQARAARRQRTTNPLFLMSGTDLSTDILSLT